MCKDVIAWNWMQRWLEWGKRSSATWHFQATIYLLYRILSIKSWPQIGHCIKKLLTLFGCQFFPPALEWSMMERETRAARRKATLCLPPWLETMGSSFGPPAVGSTSVGSLGRPQFYLLARFLCCQLLFSCFWNMICWLRSPEQPRHPVWWTSPSRSVSTSTPSNFLGSCTTRTHSASGSLAPRLNCAASILSRWDTHLNIFALCASCDMRAQIHHQL